MPTAMSSMRARADARRCWARACAARCAPPAAPATDRRWCCMNSVALRVGEPGEREIHVGARPIGRARRGGCRRPRRRSRASAVAAFKPMADRRSRPGRYSRAIASLMITGGTGRRGDRDPRTGARPAAECRAPGNSRRSPPASRRRAAARRRATGRSARSNGTVQLLPVSGVTAADAGVLDLGQRRRARANARA